MKKLQNIPLAQIGVSFLLLSPAVYARDYDKNVKAMEIAQTQVKAEEKGKAKLAEEVAKRTEEAAERAKEAAELAEEKAGRAKEAAEVAEIKKPEDKGEAKRAQEAAERTQETAERAKIAAERAEQAAERGKERAERAKETADKKEPATEPEKKVEKSDTPGKADAPDKGQGGKESGTAARERNEQRRVEDARERRERPARPDRPAVPATSAAPATPTTPATPAIPATPANPRGDEKTPPIDMPVVPSTPLIPREKPPGKDGTPDREVILPRVPDAPAPREIIEIAPTEPERQAETKVTEVTQEVLRDLEQRKTRIEGREQAQALIDDILGAESQISRAEIAREERFRQRFEHQRPGEERFIEVTPDQRREATTYYQERLLGHEVEGPPPEFFRRSEFRGDTVDERVVERVEFVRPRYLNEGRRYVHYDSRASIPAVLMAAQAMDYVRFQPTREIAPMFYERQEVSAPYAMPLPPENYRGQDSVVVSYPVDEKSMISSEAILFLQGSTQFADPYSYEVVGVMADAMKAMPEEERFVIEGHASAEGSYESNMILSQQRAELIVREIVRRGGVSPYRLLPVGYGESEARHPEDAAERLRGQDRRVVVFRMKSEPVAKR